VLLMDTDHVLLSGLTTDVLSARWEDTQEENNDG